MPPNQQATASVIQSNVLSRNWKRGLAIAPFYHQAASLDQPAAASHLPSSRRRVKLAGMAKPIAKLVTLLTPKRRWAQFSLATMLVVVSLLSVGLSLAIAPAGSGESKQLVPPVPSR
jgi:hypothetical protein